MRRDPMRKPLGVRKGAWTEEEDKNLRICIENFGEGKWHLVPLKAGLNRCRKSCRLRWLNYLKPGIKRGEFSTDEVDLIIRLHKLLGNRWALIAGRIPGRTASDIKNYWNTNLRKKELSCKEDVKSKPKTITKTNIFKPRPRTFSKNLCWFRGKGNAFVDIDGKFGDEDLCKPCSSALTTSDNNESDWWKSMFNDLEINLESNTNWLGYGPEFETPKNLFEEEIKAPRETKIGNLFSDQGQSCWNDILSDVDLWTLINTEQEQNGT